MQAAEVRKLANLKTPVGLKIENKNTTVVNLKAEYIPLFADQRNKIIVCWKSTCQFT